MGWATKSLLKRYLGGWELSQLITRAEWGPTGVGMGIVVLPPAWGKHLHNPMFTKCPRSAGAGHTGMAAGAREIGSLGVTGCPQHCTGT